MSNAAVHVDLILRLQSALLREGISLRAAAPGDYALRMAARYHREG
ncbi:MAG: hypothetical protein IJG34_04570 [Synergistaceae bacterium]|nr:hypothetical protein [Synergistaceae bacterium]MBQ3449152.1 hypothetical protein [Synergistaceae bacterium]MBQ6111167.1 hypothetical protein [Synergistaceae bacterium]MBQ9628951.1 hypothetical protein [Synergistaceae bacterium]MBR0251204.1 hypothetical protein [Synergistaceae bacterium]